MYLIVLIDVSEAKSLSNELNNANCVLHRDSLQGHFTPMPLRKSPQQFPLHEQLLENQHIRHSG